MKLNKQGVTRIVLLTKRYAVKFPRLNYGWEKFIAGVFSNLSENQCWQACKNHCGELLCPVLFSFGGFILIMPRLKICKTLEEISHVPKEEGQDYKPDNYGYYKGKVVCIDYPYHRINLYYKLQSNQPKA